MPPRENLNSLGICLGRKGCHSHLVQNCLQTSFPSRCALLFWSCCRLRHTQVLIQERKGTYPIVLIFFSEGTAEEQWKHTLSAVLVALLACSREHHHCSSDGSTAKIFAGGAVPQICYILEVPNETLFKFIL